MFDVPCHLIQHIAPGLSGSWCDSSPCKNGCTGAAWVAYNFLYLFFKDSEFFLVPLSFLYLMLGSLMNVANILVSFFISVAKTLIKKRSVNSATILCFLMAVTHLFIAILIDLQ